MGGDGENGRRGDAASKNFPASPPLLVPLSS